MTVKQVVSIPITSVRRDLDLLDAAMFLLTIDKQLQASPLLRYHSQVRSLSQRAILPEQQQREMTFKKTTSSEVDRDSVPATTTLLQRQHNNFMEKTFEATQDQNRPETAAAPASERRPESPTANVIFDTISAQTAEANLSDADKQMLQTMSPVNRLLFAHQTLQLLHFAEFLLLIEFIEVVTPVIHCVYLGVNSHLPNRQYYASLRNLDDASLGRNITNVMVYASLEVLSFLLLSVLLYRKLRISPLKQLAFVLETQ